MSICYKNGSGMYMLAQLAGGVPKAFRGMQVGLGLAARVGVLWASSEGGGFMYVVSC